MRTLIVLSICLVAASVSQAQSMVGDELQFPYEALVLREEAPVRSGPAIVHYATDKLAAGATVEVYRHDPGGWCAIRPPSESFSLVAESAIEMVDENVGRVNSGSTQAWVGTRLGVVENPLWQVKLKESELIEILGEVSWPNPEGHSTIWYQIAPPAGEFRWIQMSDLQLPDDATQLKNLNSKTLSDIAGNSINVKDMPSPAPQTIAKPLVASGKSQQPAENEALNTSTPTSQTQPSTAPSTGPAQIVDPVQQIATQNVSPSDSIPDNPVKSINDGWRRARNPIERASAVGKQVSSQRPNRFTSPAIPSPDANTIEPSIHEPLDNSTRLVSTKSGVAAPPERLASTQDNWSLLAKNAPVQTPTTTGPVGAQLRQLEFRLTNEMLKQPASWHLDDLLLQTESLLQTAQDPMDTQHANRLIEKIKQCLKIRSGHRQAYNDNAMSNAGPDTTLNRPVGTGVDTEVELGTTYDAFGWLNELVRDNGTTTTTFVLQDEDGRVTHHISPVPGVNLHRYLKSKVGIIGQRGYHQQLNLDHVTAERVIELRKLR